METHRLEALVATRPSNVAYLTGYSFHARLEQGAPYYELGFGGIAIEDTVVVTASGCEWMTSLPRDLTPVGEVIPPS